MKIYRYWLIAVFSLATGFEVSACSVTKFYPLAWNAPEVAGTLEVLFPELLFEYDSGTRILKATGCDKQHVLLDPLLAAAKLGLAARWEAEVEKRLWDSAGQLGLLHHSVYGFDLKKPTGWKTVAITPDSAYAQRLGGKPIYGMTLTQKNAKLQFLALDLDQIKKAREVGEPDSKVPLGLWPQAITDSKWSNALGSDFLGSVGGNQAKEKTVYHARALWSTGTEKIVCERFYLAQPSLAGTSTRLYFFMITVPQGEFAACARSLESFAGGFAMPEAPMQAVLAQAPEALKNAAGPSTSSQTNVVLVMNREWQLLKSPSNEVHTALDAYLSRKLAESEALWAKLLPSLSKAERPEGLWYLARSQMEQGKYPEAIATLENLGKESSDHPLVFQAAIQEGALQGCYLHHWDQAEIALQRAAKLARDEGQHRQAAYQLALVPYYKKQYRQAVEALENLLTKYPTEQTADFVRPYLWWLKNCAEKKI